MKYIYIFTATMSLLFANIQQIKDPYKNIVYMKLDNGMQVYLLSDEKSVNTQVEVEVAVGTDIETNENHGISHLVEHMVFRDQRVPHHDYLDYMKEEGATYVNGYTSRYKTAYKANVDSNKSYWVVECFAQMLFDKNITKQDLENERGALQAEIGEIIWIEKFIWKFGAFLKILTPEKKSIYEDDFALKKAKDLPANYLDKINNKHFSMEDVMEHYNAYYYPSNTILKVAGNFDVKQMQKLIQSTYGKVNRTGSKKTIKLPKNPTLNHKPYKRFWEGGGYNYGHIGAKYILDDYKKYIILDAYTEDVALRLQQKLRNDMGQTYSINSYEFGDRKARVASVSFDGLHKDFEENIATVKSTIRDDVENLSDENIDKALKAYSKTYTSVEHDSDSLVGLINTVKYLREDHKLEKTPVDIFKTITHDDFRQVVKDTFTKNNSYSVIYRDYYFFPYDVSVISTLMFVLFLVLYFNLHHIDRMKNNLKCTHRSIVISRRLSNRFLGFLYAVFIWLISTLIWGWIKHLFSKYIVGDAHYLYTIDVPYSYFWTLSDMIITIVIFVIFSRYVFKYWAKLEVTSDALCIVGHRVKSISKKEIESIKVEPWNIVKSIKSYGTSILFWRPVLQISLKNGQVIYLRSRNAKHLAEDLKKCLSLT